MSLFYDPMIAKLSVWAPTRAEAVGRIRVALDETRVQAPKDAMGVKRGSLRTNLSFLRRLARNPDVIEGSTTTDLIARNTNLTAVAPATPSLSAALATAIYQMLHETAIPCAESKAESSVWARTAKREGVRS